MLQKLQRRLEISDDSPELEVLEDVLEDAQSAFKVITGTNTIDEKYNFMVVQVAAQLYNRRGSEGMESENVDGYSVKYVAGLYDEFWPILERDFKFNEEPSGQERQGRVVFY